ncbi:C6 transcription factor [Drechmeria coniospora]|uniref:C6 transcription factor n=1 Tax=Drechmeria coniospora TaxID=98403 RepID=A0A151GQJ3_DRECN|nr:C6 transcription factor [Drechmeria coniospora]KYK59363.1 C6 transcription factor [Drechmeria coniospora]
MAEQHQFTGLPILPPIRLVSDKDVSSKGPVKESEQQSPGDWETGQGREELHDAPGSRYHAHGGHPAVPRHRFLTAADWSIIAARIGGAVDVEQHKAVHPTHWWWPPSGMPPGLYRDIVTYRSKFFYLFHATSIIRGTLMILQLLVGATLTSLGAMSLVDGTPITVLGAINTVTAGLLALLHNSGVPDRYRYDMAGFGDLEDNIKELLDSGIVPADMTMDQVLAEFFDRFREAKATVVANMPLHYSSRQGKQPGDSAVVVVSAPEPKTGPKRGGGDEATKTTGSGSMHVMDKNEQKTDDAGTAPRQG